MLAEGDEHVWKVAELQRRGAERPAEPREAEPERVVLGVRRGERRVAARAEERVAAHGHGRVDQAAREREAVAHEPRADGLSRDAPRARGRRGEVGDGGGGADGRDAWVSVEEAHLRDAACPISTG